MKAVGRQEGETPRIRTGLERVFIWVSKLAVNEKPLMMLGTIADATCNAPTLFQGADKGVC
ncbi:MAG: hypothetical protein Q4G36_00440 [Paracoccus sp. (in: a-proteobacteria)]|nr:hypothetical protein [Paracoccus sp. (in: a-proteobacteria)]